MNTPEIGKLLTGTEPRDAIHVAVIPMLALRDMEPGDHLANGVVDPFLTEPVKPGQWYYLFLYPNTVTSLRHSWSHPAFLEEKL